MALQNSELFSQSDTKKIKKLGIFSQKLINQLMWRFNFVADYKITPSIIRTHLSHGQFYIWLNLFYGSVTLGEIEILSRKLAGNDLSN